jgi:nucleotide-binding universal stress UspA family protein
MRKILFPFEKDQTIYREAYVYAVKFARNLGAELIMLNVFEVDEDIINSPKDYKRIIRDNYFKAYQEIIRFNKHYLNNYAKLEPELRIKFDYRFLHGNIIHEITQIITKEEIDLVVLPESSKKDVYKWIVEVIWHDLVKIKPVSVLLIPEHCRYQPIKSASFVAEMNKLDLLGLYMDDVLRYAKVFDATVHFIDIVHGKKSHQPEERKNELKEISRLVGSSKKHIFLQLHDRDTMEAVEDYTQKNQVHLVFVVRHHHDFLGSLFHKDLSDQICLRSQIPVLVMKEKAD